MNKYINLWKEYDIEIVIIGCLIFIIILSIYRKIKGYKGTWSNNVFYNNSNNFITKTNNQTTTDKIQPKDSKGEIECRKTLESIFNKPFNKARPDFLRNPVTGNFNLELDCFNPELKLAVEYNGIQHYKFTPFFHRTHDAFLNQKYRDE